VPNPYPHLAESYAGIIDDISANITTNMALTRIQQNQENISGYLTVGSELQGNGSFKGTVDTSQHIQFTVIDSTGRATLSFEGIADTDGTLAGSYCTLVQQGRCVGDYGVWSVTPAL